MTRRDDTHALEERLSEMIAPERGEGLHALVVKLLLHVAALGLVVKRLEARLDRLESPEP
jgi:hypothetical protein